MADDEERDPEILLHLLPAVLDHGVCELIHVPDQGSLPLTLAVTHMIMAKHQESLSLANLSQHGVARDKMLSIAVNIFIETLSFKALYRATYKPMSEKHQSPDRARGSPGECLQSSASRVCEEPFVSLGR